MAVNTEEKLPETAPEYAGFWVRLAAYLLDAIILWFISWIIGMMMPAEPPVDQSPLAALASLYSSPQGILGLVIGIVYFVGFWRWRGQTPGKMAVGIKIIRTNGSPVGWDAVMLRYVGYIVSTITIYIGYIWIAFDSRKQGIHDKIADTCVVKVPRL